MGDLVDGLGVRLAGVMADSEGEGAQGHRAIGVGHRDEHGAEASVRPGHVRLDAAAEHRAVLPLVVAGLEPAPAGLRPRSALVVGRQRPEVALELRRAEPLLAVPGEDRLYRGIPAFHGLKRRQRGVYPILW
jgi:hypothetical protein